MTGMEKETKRAPGVENRLEEEDQTDAVELVLFQVSECYVYLIPPRKSAASYRADEWNVNKWAWEGSLKVISKAEECIIRLEDNKTGELYARAFLRNGEPHPVESVIDSSRYFVLRVEESIGGRLRHAFIGLGFRERPQAYDFQAALHDHMKYLNKKKTAEEMEQHYQQTSSVDYSLKEGQTLVLQLKNSYAPWCLGDQDQVHQYTSSSWKKCLDTHLNLGCQGVQGRYMRMELCYVYWDSYYSSLTSALQKGSGNAKSAFFERNLSNLSLDEKASSEGSPPVLKPPPPPPAPLSPVGSSQQTDSNPRNFGPQDWSNETTVHHTAPKVPSSVDGQSPGDIVDEDFGDFQAAG